MALLPAAAVALVATIPLALIFAQRTSLAIFPALTFILWRGIGARFLTLVAAGLLGMVVPIAYAITLPEELRRLQLRVQHRADLGPLDRGGRAHPSHGGLLEDARGRSQTGRRPVAALGAVAQRARRHGAPSGAPPERDPRW